MGERACNTWLPTGIGAARLRSRAINCRMAIPHSQAPTPPSPRNDPADFQTATNVS
jgi:hypothetical protein